MAASKLFLLSSSLFRSQRKNLFFFPKSPSLFSPSSHPISLSILRSLAGTPPPNLRFYASTSAAVDDPAASLNEPPAAAPTPSETHPWPEWERFVEKLRVKGYFEIPSPGGDAGVSVAPDVESVYETMELNRLKNACLKFARERFDILRSLPKEDIQAVVECGCPNLFRKAVNSAKKLRAFLGLDEADVCNACNLKGSCDKAYVLAKEDEAARTVDIVRILLTYAINPAALSGGENALIKVQVQESAQKLLSELIKLSDTTIDPALPKQAVNSSSKKEQSQKVVSKNNLPQNVEMKRGDWLCTKCNFLNFARNVRCLECNEDGPKRVNFEGAEMKLGDWTCPKCNFLNFARNVRCLECNVDGPKRVNFEGAEMKLGDWTCPQCQFMNFARNKKCIRCHGSRPKRELNPGEWECPSCDFLNFRRNEVCLKCNRGRPSGENSQIEDHMWRKPRLDGRNATLKFGDDDDDDEFDDGDGVMRLVTSKKAMPSEKWPSSSMNSRGDRKNAILDIVDDVDDEEEEDDDDILPLQKGENRFVASKRATPSERRLTSARKRKL